MTTPDLARLQQITWDEDGYADFHDAEGFGHCPNVSTARGVVFVDDLTAAYLTPTQARAIAARLVECAEEAER